MRIAILFSGQGGQQPEHLERLKAEADPELAAALALAVPELWQGGGAALSCNRLAQPLIFGYQMMLWRQLQIPKPICVAGYSLGEMTACCVAGAFPAKAGVALCAERARLMDAAFPEPAGLLAIIGLNRRQVEEVAHRHGLHLSIVNGQNHMVLGGSKAALAEAEVSTLALGATRTVILAVTTPSHTPLLAEAGAGFRQILANQNLGGRLAFPVLSAVDGRAAYTPSAALAALSRQIDTTLDWAACLENLLEMQPDRVLEIGPGNALARMLEERAPGLPVRATGDFRSVEGIHNWLT